MDINDIESITKIAAEGPRALEAAGKHYREAEARFQRYAAKFRAQGREDIAADAEASAADIANVALATDLALKIKTT